MQAAGVSRAPKLPGCRSGMSVTFGVIQRMWKGQGQVRVLTMPLGGCKNELFY